MTPAPDSSAPASRYALLALPELRLYLGARFFSGFGFTLFRAALAWQVYDKTGSELYLAAIGVLQFVPTLALSLVAGALSDRYDRRAIAVAAQAFASAAALALAAATWAGNASTALIFAAILVDATAATFENPAGAALLPALVARAQFATAAALQGSVRNVAWVTGPVVAGLLIARFGVWTAYALHAVLLLVSIALLLPLRPRPPETAIAIDLAAMREGIRFVRQRPEILGAMALDMLAVVFGAAEGLLPVFARDVLQVGPSGYGVLSASFQAGTVLMALVLVAAPPIQRVGRALLLAVAAYALATVAFGLSQSYALSLLCYAAAGMADQVSVVARSTLIQLATPDALRGRVNAVNFLFIGASNQLGTAEAGFVAGFTTARFAVVSGGLAALAICGAMARLNPRLRSYAIHP
jgi:MFS family permease